MRKHLERAAEKLRYGVPRLALNLCQAGSLAVIALGFYMLAPWLGVVIGGLGLFAVGLAFDGGK